MVHRLCTIVYGLFDAQMPNVLFLILSKLSRINRDDRFIVACNELLPSGFSEINICSIQYKLYFWKNKAYEKTQTKISLRGFDYLSRVVFCSFGS